ncbi:protein cornichon homolog 4-like [Hibiscus syriacus]|uniref:protein cornichon homolog 4-like n=1 Tax=Hibiscus syriacus TaxID=106335 RepID=UPI0019245620|nr:protein cornichon homolog 4-like [Hibiscus syriacus]
MRDIFTWLTSFLILIALILIIPLQLMCLDDLEFDYINPYDYSSRVKILVLLEFMGEGILCLFYLVTGHWVMSMLCAPISYFNVRLYATGEHLVDVTEVFLLLRREKNLRRLKLAYLTILLFLDVLWMIRSAIEDQDDDEDYGADSFLD